MGLAGWSKATILLRKRGAWHFEICRAMVAAWRMGTLTPRSSRSMRSSTMWGSICSALSRHGGLRHVRANCRQIGGSRSRTEGVRAELRFRCPDVERQSECSISVLFRGRLIHRVDVVPNHIRKPNPAAALKLGLPAKIDGPHAHEWRNNRDIVRRNGQFGTLPCRSQLPPQVTKLSQALAELAKQINLQLPPEAHAFEVPPKATLFG